MKSTCKIIERARDFPCRHAENYKRQSARQSDPAAEDRKQVDDFAERDDLFDWAFASFADRPLVDTQTEITTVALTKCRTEPAVALYAAAPVSGYGHAEDNRSLLHISEPTRPY